MLDDLQIVTRAANFLKATSGELDWLDKTDALERMAIAIQRRRREASQADRAAD